MLKKTLDKFGKAVIQQSRTRLTKDKSNYTKDLYNGLKYETKQSSSSTVISFSMPFHGAVLDEGISGVRKKRSTRFSYKKSSNLIGFEAATGSFGRWAKSKGIKGRDKKTGRFITTKQLGFMIASSVKLKGKKGTKFFTKSFDLEFAKLPDELLNSYSLDLDIILKNSL